MSSLQKPEHGVHFFQNGEERKTLVIQKYGMLLPRGTKSRHDPGTINHAKNQRSFTFETRGRSF
jgi:hypothetical protein